MLDGQRSNFHTWRDCPSHSPGELLTFSGFDSNRGFMLRQSSEKAAYMQKKKMQNV
jgi:hypothetical protein